MYLWSSVTATYGMGFKLMKSCPNCSKTIIWIVHRVYSSLHKSSINTREVYFIYAENREFLITQIKSVQFLTFPVSTLSTQDLVVIDTMIYDFYWYLMFKPDYQVKVQNMHGESPVVTRNRYFKLKKKYFQSVYGLWLLCVLL